MYRCNRCGASFEEPATRRIMENLDGENGWYAYIEECCPYCSSQEFEEAAEDDEDEPDE